MLKSGYALIDCKGLDLTGGSAPQTIAGLYARLAEVMKYGKPMIAQNCVMGTGKPMTPLNVSAYQYDTHTIYVFFGTLEIVVTDGSTNNVTVVDLADTTNRTAKKKEVK